MLEIIKFEPLLIRIVKCLLSIQRRCELSDVGRTDQRELRRFVYVMLPDGSCDANTNLPELPTVGPAYVAVFGLVILETLQDCNEFHFANVCVKSLQEFGSC